LLITNSGSAYGGTTPPQEQPPAQRTADKATLALRAEIAAADARMFDAFNAHDLDAMMALFADSVEFYHDKGGLQSKADLRTGFRSLFARNDGLRRDLLTESFEVHPIGTWGAMSAGKHRFCHKENGADDCGTFKFLMVWQKDAAGTWQVTRAVSYDH